MASQANSEFLYNVIKNTKSSFIQHRHLLNNKDKDWRSHESSYAVNNITGSGMLSACIQAFGDNFSLGLFPHDLFNQDPIIFNSNLIGRHLHSSLWGDDYINHESKEAFIIKEGNILNCTKEFLKTNLSAQKWEDFDFYRNYNDT